MFKKKEEKELIELRPQSMTKTRLAGLVSALVAIGFLIYKILEG